MNRNPVRLALAFALLSAVVLGAPTAALADSGEGAVRLGADVTVFDVYVLPDTMRDATVQAGILSSGLTVPSSFAMHGAYQLTDQLLIGVRATLGLFSIAGFETGLIGLLPFGEYLLMTGDIAPFVGAHVGPTIFFPEVGDAQANLVAGGEFGAHIFLDPAFSVSPAIWANFFYEGGSERAGFEFILLASMSGWLFGGGVSSSAAPAPAPEPTPSY